jgi:heme exporter protein CcmD
MIRFVQMGGYAVYVWPAFALALVVMLLNIVWARRSLRAAQLEARRRVLSAQPLQRPVQRAATQQPAEPRP